MKLAELAERLGARIERAPDGVAEREVSRVMTLEDADGASLSFITNLKYLPSLKSTRAAAVLCDARTLELHGADFPCPALVTSNAYVSFAQSVGILHPAPTHAPGVHPLAFVHPEAQLGPNVTVMALAYVGRATVGAGSVIHPFVFLDDDVTVGAECTLYPHAVLMRGTVLGARNVLQPGCVLGSDGFGFAPDAQGRLHKIPQVGTVTVEDDVEIGANTTIDRAALGATVLGEGTKLDNQVQVAHNVVLGKHVVMCGQSAVAGSSKLSDHVMVGGGSGVGGHITMGVGSKLTGGSFVMHDVPAGETWMGSPALHHTTRGRLEIHYRHLDEHVKMLRQLNKRVASLEAQLQAATQGKGEKA